MKHAYEEGDVVLFHPMMPPRGHAPEVVRILRIDPQEDGRVFYRFRRNGIHRPGGGDFTTEEFLSPLPHGCEELLGDRALD